MSPAFDEYVFNPEVKTGIWSDQSATRMWSTKGGYWLIKVVDRANNRQLDSADRDSLIAKALNEWVSSLWA